MASISSVGGHHVRLQTGDAAITSITRYRSWKESSSLLLVRHTHGQNHPTESKRNATLEVSGSHPSRSRIAWRITSSSGFWMKMG